jgi:cytochrome c oxidase cbb3-type subunit I/II
MPAYPWLFDQDWNKQLISAKISAMEKLGVPYSQEAIENALKTSEEQALSISNKLKSDGIEVSPDREIVALIAYLQRLGTDIKAKNADDLTEVTAEPEGAK